MAPTETLATPLTELLKMKYPIILAGMGASAGPKVVAAVSNAGGLGVLGGISFTPEQLRAAIREVKALLHDKTAFGVDLALPQVGGNARKTNHDYTHGKLPELIDICIEEQTRLFVSAVGVPPKWAVDKLHSAGILCMNMIGLPNHVKKAHEVGMDIMGATGYEAAGHTGEVGTLVAIPQIVDACRGLTSPLTKGPVHVVAAGGIYDGRTLAAVLSLGAEAAWVGTRLLASTESSPVKALEHKKTIVAAKPTDTVRSLVYSGRPNRMYKIDYLKDWEINRKGEIEELTANGIIPFQADWKKHEEAGTLAAQIGYEKGFSVADKHRFLMGQCSAAITSIKSSKEIIEGMMEEAVEVLKNRSSLIKKLPPAEPLPRIDEPVVLKPSIPPNEYTVAEIAQHRAPNDCWMVVNGMVLDFSKFEHPGGPEVMMMFAGKDASTEFNMMHGEQMIYKHSPQSIIGTVKAAPRL